MEQDSTQEHAPESERAADSTVCDELNRDELVREELLVEEISIDGMCGVY
ncbi:MAG: hypothetical protein RLZZ305_231 [Actinomycetota bacterium]|jgi:mycofactocin precursor